MPPLCWRTLLALAIVHGSSISESVFADAPRTRSRVTVLEQRVEELISLNLQLAATLEQREGELSKLRAEHEQQIGLLRAEIESLQSRSEIEAQALRQELADLKAAQARLTTQVANRDADQKPTHTTAAKRTASGTNRRPVKKSPALAVKREKEPSAAPAPVVPRRRKYPRNVAPVYHTAFGSGIAW